MYFLKLKHLLKYFYSLGSFYFEFDFTLEVWKKNKILAIKKKTQEEKNKIRNFPI